jgi:hypothetical protein
LKPPAADDKEREASLVFIISAANPSRVEELFLVTIIVATPPAGPTVIL